MSYEVWANLPDGPDDNTWAYQGSYALEKDAEIEAERLYQKYGFQVKILPARKNTRSAVYKGKLK